MIMKRWKMIKKYRKKPVVIEAIQWNGSNAFEIWNDFEDIPIRLKEEGTLLISTLEGDHIASIGDYIIKGIKGELYPCKPDIFEETYEEVES